MNFLHVALLAVVLVNFSLMVLVYRLNPKNIINQTFALSVLSLTLWSIMVFVVHSIPVNNNHQLLIQIQHFFGLCIVFFLLIFSWHFPYQSRHITVKTYMYWVLLWAVGIAGVLLHAHYGIPVEKKGWMVYYSCHFIPFGLYALSFFWLQMSAYREMIKKYNRSDGFHRVQLYYILTATIFGGLPAAIIGVLILFLMQQGGYGFDSVAAIITSMILVVIYRFVFIASRR